MISRRYMPRPGSVPARAIAYLWTCPPGTEVTTDVLATAAGFNRKNATAFLEPEVKGGALRRRPSQRNDPRAPTLWALGDKAPTVAEIEAEANPRGPQVQRPAVMNPEGKTHRAPLRSIFDARPDERRDAMAAPVPQPGSFMAEWRQKRGEG